MYLPPSLALLNHMGKQSEPARAESRTELANRHLEAAIESLLVARAARQLTSGDERPAVPLTVPATEVVTDREVVGPIIAEPVDRRSFAPGG